MESSAKRESSSSITDEDPEAKKLKLAVAGDLQPSQTPVVMPRRVTLNPADCNLDFCIGFNGLQGSALYENEFAYCWSGARANVGTRGGKYCFGCKIIAYQPVNDDDEIPVDHKNVCRVGVSRGDDNSLGSLGETMNSFCIQSTRKFSSAGRFSDYGERFEIGDTIVCCVDLEAKPASIGFSKNGRWMGIACHFDGGIDPPKSAFFPHVLLKNVIVHLQFCREDGLEPVEGYKPWAYAIQDGKAFPGPALSSDVHDCELIMMVGLPGSGKTTWAEKWVKDHPEKRYILLGENLAFDQMKVPSLLYKCNYDELFECWIDRASKIFSALVSRASKLPRNFIIDHTNVYKGSRRHRLKPFANYHKVAVVVFPTPEEFKSRVDRRYKEMGKEIPASIINEALAANFVLPMSKDMHGTDEYFDEVLFPELGRADSEKYLVEMKANMNASDMEASPYSQENSLQVLGEQTQSSCTHLPAITVHHETNPADLCREVDMDAISSIHGDPMEAHENSGA